MVLSFKIRSFAHNEMDVLDTLMVGWNLKRTRRFSSIDHFALQADSGPTANQSAIPRCKLRLFSLGGGDVKNWHAEKGGSIIYVAR